MEKVYALIADGTEETELLAVVDILRRAGVDVDIVSADGLTVRSSHGVAITADKVLADVELCNASMIFVPGGLAGSRRLAETEQLIEGIRAVLAAGGRVAAICAAPALVLGAHGLLAGKRAVCFPGFEDKMHGAKIETGARVVTDGNITTSRGLGCAIDLGLELVSLLKGRGVAEEIKAKIQY